MRYETTKPISTRNQFNSFLTDRVLNDYFSSSDDTSNSAFPTVDIIEKNDQYLVQADLPGMNQKDIEIGLTNGVLTIRGERKRHEETEKEGYYRTERVTGQFTRSFTVNDVDEKNIKAEYGNGVLTVHLPKAEEKKERKIAIT